MALTFDLTLNSFSNDCSTYNICDSTVYGNGEAERNTRANYLVAWYLLENSSEPTYVNVVPVDADETANSEYTFDTPRDDSYYFKLFSISIYNGIGAFVLNDVRYYAATDKVYIAIQAGTDVAPDAVNGSQFWEEILMTSSFEENKKDFRNIIGNSSLEEFDYEDIITCRLDDGLRDALEKAIDKGLCKPNCDVNEFTEDLDRLYLFANGAEAKNWEQKPVEASRIIRCAIDFIDLQ